MSARLFVAEKERIHLLTVLGEEAPQNIKAALPGKDSHRTEEETEMPEEDQVEDSHTEQQSLPLIEEQQVEMFEEEGSQLEDDIEDTSRNEDCEL